jgi:hypothetical protein
MLRWLDAGGHTNRSRGEGLRSCLVDSSPPLRIAAGRASVWITHWFRNAPPLSSTRASGVYGDFKTSGRVMSEGTPPELVSLKNERCRFQ